MTTTQQKTNSRAFPGVAQAGQKLLLLLRLVIKTPYPPPPKKHTHNRASAVPPHTTHTFVSGLAWPWPGSCWSAVACLGVETVGAWVGGWVAAASGGKSNTLGVCQLPVHTAHGESQAARGLSATTASHTHTHTHTGRSVSSVAHQHKCVRPHQTQPPVEAAVLVCCEGACCKPPQPASQPPPSTTGVHTHKSHGGMQEV